MVVEAAFAIARAGGIESVNARTVAQRLGCSTQPVMYHFSKIEEMKRAVYQRTDRFHTEYLMDVGPEKDRMLGIGLNYIRFGVEEPHLFRLLFQSGFAVENTLPEMLDSRELEPVLAAMGEDMGLDKGRTREVFLTLAMFVHGYASILANNALEYDEKAIAVHLERVCRGAVLALQEETE